jgi:hypothetical protein
MPERDTQDSIIIQAPTAGNERDTQDSIILGATTAGLIRDTQDSIILGVPSAGLIRDTQDCIILWTPINYNTGITQITGGAFQDAAGNPVAFGNLVMLLSQDAKLVTTGKVVQAIRKFIPLDANGNISGTQYVIPNDVLVPSGTTYKVWVQKFDGTQVWGPHNETVLSTSPFSINANWTTTN